MGSWQIGKQADNEGGTHEEVLGLDVSVADAYGVVDVGEGAAHLVSVELDEEEWDALVEAMVVLRHPVYRLRHIL